MTYHSCRQLWGRRPSDRLNKIIGRVYPNEKPNKNPENNVPPTDLPNATTRPVQSHARRSTNPANPFPSEIWVAFSEIVPVWPTRKYHANNPTISPRKKPPSWLAPRCLCREVCRVVFRFLPNLTKTFSLGQPTFYTLSESDYKPETLRYLQKQL